MKKLFEGFRRFINEQQDLPAALGAQEYAKRAQALGFEPNIHYGDLLGELSAMYLALLRHPTAGQRNMGWQPVIIDELRGVISVKAAQAGIAALEAEEEISDKMSEDQKLQSAAKNVPAGKSPLKLLLSSPLVQQKMSEHPYDPEKDRYRRGDEEVDDL